MSQPESGIPGSVGEDKMGWNSKAGLIDDCQSWLFKVAGDCQTWWNPCSLCNGHQPPTLTGARQFSILWSSRRRSCCPFDLMPPLPLSTVGHINKLLVRLGGRRSTLSIVPPPLYTCTQPFDPCCQPVILAQCVGPTSSKMKTPFVSLSKQSSNDDDIKLPCMSRINILQLVWFIYMWSIMISYQPSPLSKCWWWGRHSNAGNPSDVGTDSTRRCWRCDKKDKKETGPQNQNYGGAWWEKSGTCDGCRYRAIATSDRDSLPLLSTNRSISWYTTNYQLSIGQNPNNYPSSSSSSSSSNLCLTWLSYLESNIQERMGAQQQRSRVINEGKLASGGLRPWLKAPPVLLGSTHSHILSSFLGTLGLEQSG